MQSKMRLSTVSMCRPKRLESASILECLGMRHASILIADRLHPPQGIALMRFYSTLEETASCQAPAGLAHYSCSASLAAKAARSNAVGGSVGYVVHWRPVVHAAWTMVDLWTGQAAPLSQRGMLSAEATRELQRE